MILEISNLPELRTQCTGKKIIFSDGTFDLIHTGHVNVFKEISTFGDILVIAVLSDEWVKSKKGTERPILSENERLEMVDAIRYVDYSVLAKDLQTGQRVPITQILQELKPDFFVAMDKSWKDKEELIQSCGTQLKIIDRIGEGSTTKLLDRIKGILS
jgi:rfaE bifunctional protein nucleotidyltransferase chain/domain